MNELTEKGQIKSISNWTKEVPRGDLPVFNQTSLTKINTNILPKMPKLFMGPLYYACNALIYYLIKIGL